MNIAQIHEALLWCVILNIGLVTVWSILVLVAKGWLNGIILKWFRVPAEHCDMINLTGIVLYKVGKWMDCERQIATSGPALLISFSEG
jgi:hypothetical protein